MLTARRRAIHRDLGSVPLHPLLAAAYPVVFLFATNAAEQVTLDPLWAPLAWSVGTAAAVLVVMGALTRNWQGAGLVTTVLVIGFFGYGHAWNAVAGMIDNQRMFALGWLGLVGIALYVVTGLRGSAVNATRALNVVAAVLLVVNAWSLATAMVAFGAHEPAGADLSPIDLAPHDPNDLPDVYNIIVDRYAGPTALAETYGFDNEPFLTALEERGFAVARHAHANYIKTPLSVVSSLNMEFLDPEPLKAEAKNSADRAPIQRQLSGHLVVPTALKEIGYSYVHIGSWWAPTKDNIDADRTFVYEGQDEFTSVLGQTTILRALSADAAPDDPWDWPSMRANNLYALDRLEEVPALPGPKFVFAHLVTTHPPYVHNADGSMTGREQVERLGDLESYVRQLQYANTRLLGIIDRILASDPDAVIWLQADEGPFPLRYDADDWTFKWRQATDEELEQKFGILFAMRVPGADLEAAGFHDGITAVNGFRIIFNARFGTDLELLPDRVYAHEDLTRFYDFVDITDRLDRG